MHVNPKDIPQEIIKSSNNSSKIFGSILLSLKKRKNRNQLHAKYRTLNFFHSIRTSKVIPY